MLPKYMVRALRERMERKENVFIIWETLSNGLTMNGLKIKSFKNGVRWRIRKNLINIIMILISNKYKNKKKIKRSRKII